MIADLQCTLALVRHVAVGTRNTRTRVDPLVPHLKLRMLRFEHRRARVCMFPVFKLLLIVKSENVLNLKSLGPGVDQPLFRATEMIFIVTLPTNEGAHLLPRRLFIHIVILNPLRGLQSAHAFDERRTRYTQLHRLRIMTIDTRDRMVNKLSSLEIRRLIQCFEAFENISAAELFV